MSTVTVPFGHVLASSLCPSWCRHPHAGETVAEGEGTNHFAEPILDDATACVQVSCWTDAIDGRAVPEPPTVMVTMGGEPFLSPTQVRRLIAALTTALQAAEAPDESLSKRLGDLIEARLAEKGITLDEAAAHLGISEAVLCERLHDRPLLVTDLWSLSALLGVAPSVLVADAMPATSGQR